MSNLCKDCKHWKGNDYATRLCQVSHNWHVAIDSCCCYYKKKAESSEGQIGIMKTLATTEI